MLRRKFGFQRPLMMALALVLAFSAGSVLTASGQGDVTFYGCEIPNGMVILISTHEVHCPRRTNPVSWGSQGVPGPAGQSGLSHAYFDQGFDLRESEGKFVMSVAVPAGSYVVTAQVRPQESQYQPDYLTCSMHPGHMSATSTQSILMPILSSVTLVDAVTLTEDGTIAVECPRPQPASAYQLALDGMITAVAVDALN